MTIARPGGLLVDFGGVMTTDIWSSFSAFCSSRGLAEEAVKDLFRSDPEALSDLREMETGRIEVPEFERRFAARLEIEADGLVQDLFAGVEPEPRMIDAVRDLREAGVPTGMVSNSWGRTTYDDRLIDELFIAVVISGDVGLHKPEPAIYHLAAERLGLPPGELVFVDDLRENCRGAEAVGMTAVLHRDAGETVARLEELFGLPLDRGGPVA